MSNRAICGAFIMVSLGAMLYGGLNRASGPWQLATEAPGNNLAQAAHVGHVHLAQSQGKRPAAKPIRAVTSTPSLNAAAVETSRTGSTADSGGHGSPQVAEQQAPHAMGQRHTAPATNGLDRLLLEGRFSADHQTGQLAFEWSLSTIRARFEGTALAADLRLLRGGPDYYAVQLDGGEPRLVEVTGGQTRLQLFEDLEPGHHEVALTKRTEPNTATALFSGFVFPLGGDLLEAPAPKPRRIEIIGDSISAGYGNECRSEEEQYRPGTTNAFMTYGAITGRALDAEVRIIAWSGKGLYRNADHVRSGTMVARWSRTLPALDFKQRWNFAIWQPHVVVVNLMTNDYAPPPPASDVMLAAWLRFLRLIRQKYPAAAIVLTLGPMMNDSFPPEYPGCLSKAREVLQQAVQDTDVQDVTFLEFQEEHTLNLPLGYSGHPSVAVHEVMAERLTTAVRNITGW